MDSTKTAPRKSGNRLLRLWLWLGLSDKSPWDMIQLLLLPILFVCISYFLNEAANERQSLDVEARFQQGVIKDYYDIITKLVLENNLSESTGGDPVSDVAKAYTFNVLETVDGSKKRGILHFLFALGLINKDKPVIAFEMGGAGDQYEFRRISFRGADLSGMYLWKVRLAYADLRETNLLNASLVRSQINFADLRKACLRGARLEQTDLRNSLLTNCDLSNANLGGANLIGAKLEGCLLSEARLKNVLYSKSTAWPEGFDPKSQGAMCICPNADLRNTILTSQLLYRVELSNADLSGADLQGSRLEGAKLKNAILSGANLQNAALQGADFTGARLDSVNLKGAYTKQTVFENAFFCHTIMPDGSINNGNCPLPEN